MCSSCSSVVRSAIYNSSTEAQISPEHKDVFPESFIIQRIEDWHDPQEIQGPVYYDVTVQVNEAINYEHIKKIWNEKYIEEIDAVGLSPTGDRIVLEDIRPYRRNIFVCIGAFVACTLTFFFILYAIYILPALSVLSTLYSARQFIQKSLVDGDMMSRLMSLGLILAYANMGYMLYSILIASMTMSFSIAMMAFLLPIALILMANFMNYIMLKMSHQRAELIKKILDDNKVAEYYEVYTQLPSAEAQVFDNTDNYKDSQKTKNKHRAEIEPGDIVRIEPGQGSSVNGMVVQGCGIWDTSVRDGETARFVKGGDQIPGGAVYHGGEDSIWIKATSKWEDCELSDSTLRAFSNPQENNEQKQADERAISNDNFLKKHGRHLLLLYFLILLVVAILLPYFFAPSVTLSIILSNVMDVLFSTCPCAISIALLYPNIALLSNLNHYFDIKGTKALSKLKAITTIVFDKTGTLTANQSTVIDFFSTEQRFNETILPAVTVLENQWGKRHPIGRGIYSYGMSEVPAKELPQVEVIDVATNGIAGRYQDKYIYIGNEKYIKKHGGGIPSRYEDETQKSENMALTPVYVAQADEFGAGHVKGVFFLRNELKEDALKTLKALKELEYQLVLLSGDRKKALTAFNINLLASSEHDEKKIFKDEDIISADTPQKKQKYIESLLAQDKNLCYIGDGFNDAPGMRAIENKSQGMTIAVGTGTAAAQVAELSLKNSSLYDIVRLFQLKDIDVGIDLIIKQNLTIIFFFLTCIASFVVTASIIGMAMPPTLMVVLMLSSTLSTYLNAQRTRFIIEDRIGDGGYLTQFLASPYFFTIAMIGALLIFASLQTQLILTGHLAFISFALISTTMMSACFLGGISIVGICLALFAFEYVDNLYQQRLKSRHQTESTGNVNTSCLAKLSMRLGIFSRNERNTERANMPSLSTASSPKLGSTYR